MKIITKSLIFVIVASFLLSTVVTVVDTTTASGSDCSSYKTFTSPEYRFEIEYPSSLDLMNGLSTENPPNLFFITFTSDCDVGSMALFIYPNNKTLEQFIDDEMEGTGFEWDQRTLLKSPTPVTIDRNISGLEFSYTGGGGLTMTKNVVFIHGDKIYHYWYKDPTQSFNNEQYEHVRDSIHFLN
jgi:hypothetical protein